MKIYFQGKIAECKKNSKESPDTLLTIKLLADNMPVDQEAYIMALMSSEKNASRELHITIEDNNE